jgi:hypothetical protein
MCRTVLLKILVHFEDENGRHVQAHFSVIGDDLWDRRDWDGRHMPLIPGGQSVEVQGAVCDEGTRPQMEVTFARAARGTAKTRGNRSVQLRGVSGRGRSGCECPQSGVPSWDAAGNGGKGIPWHIRDDGFIRSLVWGSGSGNSSWTAQPPARIKQVSEPSARLKKGMAATDITIQRWAALAQD